jgi:hypothetical protein
LEVDGIKTEDTPTSQRVKVPHMVRANDMVVVVNTSKEKNSDSLFLGGYVRVCVCVCVWKEIIKEKKEINKKKKYCYSFCLFIMF